MSCRPRVGSKGNRFEYRRPSSKDRLRAGMSFFGGHDAVHARDIGLGRSPKCPGLTPGFLAALGQLGRTDEAKVARASDHNCTRRIRSDRPKTRAVSSFGRPAHLLEGLRKAG